MRILSKNGQQKSED